MLSSSNCQEVECVVTKRFYNNVNCFTKITMDRCFQATWQNCAQFYTIWHKEKEFTENRKDTDKEVNI